jgi:DNA polymerase III, delta subunit
MFFVPIIFLTSTKLDLNNAQNLIYFSFLKKRNYSEIFDLINLNEKLLESVDLQKIWQKGLASKQLTIANLEAKSDWNQEMSSFYTNYPKPSLVFLADLANLSIIFQEGMLRFLEEPPQNLQIVLFAQNKSQILSTIQSRCQFFSLPKSFIYQNLSLDFLAKIKKKFPLPKLACQNLLNQKPLQIEKINDLEREEIDFWLWQLESYLIEFFKQNPNPKIAKTIEKVLLAKKFNFQNLQKKFVLDYLSL